jgi:hypothetical protein
MVSKFVVGKERARNNIRSHDDKGSFAVWLSLKSQSFAILIINRLRSMPRTESIIMMFAKRLGEKTIWNSRFSIAQ